MKGNKHIERDSTEATKIYDNRSLQNDYRTLQSLIKPGMTVLDVGCGTGAISKDIAKVIGKEGKVIGIDNTEKFILSGQDSWKDVDNLQLLHSDLFDFETHERFDLIIAARVLQWLTTPKEALLKMKSLLKPRGHISILDYNHEQIEWQPTPPTSMKIFYKAFLTWRAEAGMNNHISDDLSTMMTEVGFQSVEVLNADEYYDQSHKQFHTKVGIWSKVAGLDQIVEEGYIRNEDRLLAISEYDDWIRNKAISMTMKLKETRARS